MDIKIKRIYENAADTDGYRILVDRLWPRGISKEKAKVDKWEKDIAPSPALRKVYHAGQIEFEEFKKRYIDELKNNDALPAFLKELREKGEVTFLYALKDKEKNHALLLKEYIDKSK